MRVIIADDELPARARLRRMLADIPDCEVVGEAGHGREVLQLCEELSPDIVLLDIRMPDMDGIETARHLAAIESGPAVVFTTAYDSYAIDAFDAQAIGYLLKPVRQERLTRAQDHAMSSTGAQIESLTRDDQDLPARTNLCARRNNGLRLIPVDGIMFLRADQKYVTVSHLNGEDLIDEPLKDLAQEFVDHFIRTHRNTLISLKFLERLEKTPEGHYEVWLRGCAEPLPVSRRHISAVKAGLKSNA
jgi:two-component system response regulator AlgR